MLSHFTKMSLQFGNTANFIRDNTKVVVIGNECTMQTTHYSAYIYLSLTTGIPNFKKYTKPPEVFRQEHLPGLAPFISMQTYLPLHHTPPPKFSKIGIMEQDTTSLPQLPHELLIMIFEKLGETPDMARLRLVSRKFESLAAPIFYRHMTLTPALIANFAPKVYYKPDWNRYKSPERRSKHLFSSEKLYKYSSHQEMMLHTKHLTIKKSLDWESVLDLVKILHNLRSVT